MAKQSRKCTALTTLLKTSQMADMSLTCWAGDIKPGNATPPQNCKLCCDVSGTKRVEIQWDPLKSVTFLTQQCSSKKKTYEQWWTMMNNATRAVAAIMWKRSKAPDRDHHIRMKVRHWQLGTESTQHACKINWHYIIYIHDPCYIAYVCMYVCICVCTLYKYICTVDICTS